MRLDLGSSLILLKRSRFVEFILLRRCISICVSWLHLVRLLLLDRIKLDRVSRRDRFAVLHLLALVLRRILLALVLRRILLDLVLRRILLRLLLVDRLDLLELGV
jgi:hypothetical protein